MNSGTVWFARPSLAETCTLYSLPVSRRTHCQIKQGLSTPIGLPPLKREGPKKVELDRVKLTMPLWLTDQSA